MREFETYDVYYDQVGDFLEVTFGEPPEKSYADEIEPGIFISKNEKTEEIFAVGILSFKKRAERLKQILEKINIHLPLNISAE